jgi:hypothetical protein
VGLRTSRCSDPKGCRSGGGDERTGKLSFVTEKKFTTKAFESTSERTLHRVLCFFGRQTIDKRLRGELKIPAKSASRSMLRYGRLAGA